MLDGYRERAAALYADVIAGLQDEVAKHQDDPWFVLPWGFVSVRLAELAAATGDTPRALELLAAALPRLEAVRDTAHADQWDEVAWRDGRELHDLLATKDRRR